MAVIAMTREMGTLGKNVAQGLADQMELNVVHHELVEHGLAERLGARLGVHESAVHRYLEGNSSLLERWKIDSKRLSWYTAEEILELAQKGNVVIRGWGATGLLRGIPHVLCVRVCAPMAFRERAMMARLGIKEASVVRREIERSDAAHARTMYGLFGLDWEDPLLYHLVLNTESVPIETCVKLVRLLAEGPAFRETEDSRSVIADKLLETRIRAVLADRLKVGIYAIGIEAAVRQGKVTLTGTVGETRLASEAEQLVRAVAGVTDVDNHILVVRPHAGNV
jgi:cytidylate kinase